MKYYIIFINKSKVVLYVIRDIRKFYEVEDVEWNFIIMVNYF